MARSIIATLGEELSRTLTTAAARTPLSPPGGSRWLAVWAWSCLIAGLTLLLACGYEGGFGRINGWASTRPDWLWQWLTTLGDERVAFALSLFIARYRPRVFWALILGALVATAYSRGLKPLFDMPRPLAVLGQEGLHLVGPALRRASFPSGHSVTAGLFFGILVYYGRGSTVRLVWIAAALSAGLSRVALGVHWPVDVAFGLLGGVLGAWAGGRLAAHWPEIAVDGSVHLAFVTLACFFALTLTYSDGGYVLARPLLAGLGWTALAYTGVVYGLWPLITVWKDRRG